MNVISAWPATSPIPPVDDDVPRMLTLDSDPLESDIFRCKLCHNLLYQPRTIPCGLTLCSMCLQANLAAEGVLEAAEEPAVSSSSTVEAGADAINPAPGVGTAPCKPPPSYRCPMPDCRSKCRRHRVRMDAVDVTVRRVMEVLFPDEMESYALLVMGRKKLDALLRGMLKAEPSGSDLRAKFLRDGQDSQVDECKDSVKGIIASCFNKAIELAPYISAPWIARAKALLLIGEIQLAKKDANVAAGILPPAADLANLMDEIRSRETGLALHMSLDAVNIVDSLPNPPSVSSARPIKRLNLEALTACDLECKICCSQLHDPITAPCGHSWCRFCLLESLSHQPTCPLCRCTLPPYTFFERRPTNRILSTLLHLVTLLQPPPRGTGCTMKPPTPTPATQFTFQSTITPSSRRFIIPIFVGPLVFPGAPIFMHIFEPRYRGMVRRLMDEGVMAFGICLPTPAAAERTGTLTERGATSTTSWSLAAGSGGGGGVFGLGCSIPASATVGVCTGGSCQEYLDYGTLVRIRECQPIEGGDMEDEDCSTPPRFFLNAVGESRFRVLEQGLSDGGYNVAVVERVEDVELDDEDAPELYDQPLGTESDMVDDIMDCDDDVPSTSTPSPAPSFPPRTSSRVPLVGGCGDDLFGDSLFVCPVTSFYTSNFLNCVSSCAGPSTATAIIARPVSPTPSLHHRLQNQHHHRASQCPVTRRSQSQPTTPRPAPSTPPALGGSHLMHAQAKRRRDDHHGHGHHHYEHHPRGDRHLAHSDTPSRLTHDLDPYTRLSLLRRRVLRLLLSLPAQRRLHLEKLQGAPPRDAADFTFWLVNVAPVGEYRKYDVLGMTDLTGRVRKVVEMVEERGVWERMEEAARAGG
ncbi:LON peptidase N-terminal domain and RING finger protein 1 [Irineochytrium annulatum]|nr:LON peptidase N-terminal domain and RING finger protein 1 [Irineochytrium annulatum]